MAKIPEEVKYDPGLYLKDRHGPVTGRPEKQGISKDDPKASNKGPLYSLRGVYGFPGTVTHQQISPVWLAAP